MDQIAADSIRGDGGQLIVRPAAMTSAGAVISRMESILETILDCISEGKELSIDFVSRSLGHSPQKVQFPGKNAQEATKFTRILLILQLAHDALVSGITLTKRHIFYQHQELFATQRTVDELVDNLAIALGVHRDDLNIVASSKGVFAGPISIRLKDNTWIGPATGDAGMVLPPSGSISAINCETARWILVIEKDAIFRSLASSLFWQTSCAGPGLLITVALYIRSLLVVAKGYPDILTCSFLQLMRLHYPRIPILVLTDYDPDGLNIFRCYRLKSDFAAPGTVNTAPGISWLGIKSQHLLERESCPDMWITPPSEISQPANSQSSEESADSKPSISSTDCREPISALSARDRKVAVGMLEKLVDSEGDIQAIELRRELQVMLMMGIKAEIQWLDEAGNLAEWLGFELGRMLSVA